MYGVPRSVSKIVMVVTQGDGLFYTVKQKQIGSHCVIDRYSGIEFAFAQKSPSPWVTTITIFDTVWVRKDGRENGGTSL